MEEIEHPTLGTLRVIANPIRMGALAGHSVRRPPPALGADSRQVLEDFGLTRSEIESLVASNVVQCGKG